MITQLIVIVFLIKKIKLTSKNDQFAIINVYKSLTFIIPDSYTLFSFSTFTYSENSSYTPHNLKFERNASITFSELSEGAPGIEVITFSVLFNSLTNISPDNDPLINYLSYIYNKIN